MLRRLMITAMIGLLLLSTLTARVRAQSQPSLLGSWQQVSDIGLVDWGNVLTVADGAHLRGPHGGATYHLRDSAHMIVTNGPVKLVLTIHVSGNNLTTTGPYRGAYLRVTGRRLPLDTLPSPMEGTWRQASRGSLDVPYRLGQARVATPVTRPGDVLQVRGTARHGTLHLRGLTLRYTFTNAEYFVVNLGGAMGAYAVRLHTPHLLLLMRPGLAAGFGADGPLIAFER